MINIFYLMVILCIILYQQFYEEDQEGKKEKKVLSKNTKKNIPESNKVEQLSNDNFKVIDFDEPNPWSKIIIKEADEYPYLFHIKIKIPSLNDFENWRQIVPNINFIPRTGELVIPSKDEATALALANLIITNFSGQLKLNDILEKNLIHISITKARSYDIVQNKLREQIMENLYGAKFTTVDTNYMKDLAQSETNMEKLQNINTIDTNVKDDIEAWEGNDFSYL